VAKHSANMTDRSNFERFRYLAGLDDASFNQALALTARLTQTKCEQQSLASTERELMIKIKQCGLAISASWHEEYKISQELAKLEKECSSKYAGELEQLKQKKADDIQMIHESNMKILDHCKRTVSYQNYDATYHTITWEQYMYPFCRPTRDCIFVFKEGVMIENKMYFGIDCVETECVIDKKITHGSRNTYYHMDLEYGTTSRIWDPCEASSSRDDDVDEILRKSKYMIEPYRRVCSCIGCTGLDYCRYTRE
jgi:hypothetical protein